MNVKIIKDQAEYEAALEQLSTLMNRDLVPGSDDENLIELLQLVLKDYEEKNIGPSDLDPIEAIKFRMDQMNLLKKDLIPFIGSASKVSEVLSGTRKLSISMIRKLHKGLGIPLTSLLTDTAQASDVLHDSYIDYRQFPLKEMQKRGCFKKLYKNAKDLKEYAEELMKEFCGEYLNLLQPGHAYLRAPLHQRGKRSIDKYALSVWHICVLKKAEKLAHLPEYNKELINESWLRDLIKLSASNNGPKLAKEYLERFGIALIFEPHFKKTFLDGAAMSFKKRPIIALTLRHKRIDNFWFVLAHELSHLIKHINLNNEEMGIFIDDLDVEEHLDKIELEADKVANEAIIPHHEWMKSKNKIKSTDDIISFAKKLGINAGIVAGKIRHERKNYRIFSKLLSLKPFEVEKQIG